MSLRLPVFLILSLVLSINTRAQQEVWSAGKNQAGKIKEKGRQQTNRIKEWKKQLENWGRDNNYKYALALDARLHTNGWSGGLYYQVKKGKGLADLWQFHFSEIRQEKEIQQEAGSNPYRELGKSTPFIFGKINQAYTLQLAYGREQMLFPALLDGNMSVSLRYSAGPALALLKPYYLKLVYTDYLPQAQSRLSVEKYSTDNADQFLKVGSILGKEKWTRGLDEIKYLPGLFAELAVCIEPGKAAAFVKTITIGANAAFYSSKIEIMAERKAYPYQASFFVAMALGKRWK